MVANTRKMHEIKQRIRKILEEELISKDLFNGMIGEGILNKNHLEEIRKIVKDPKLYQDSIVAVSKDEIMNNPYLKRIQIPNISTEHFKLVKKRIIFPGTILLSDERKRDLSTMKQINSYIVCTSPLRFPGIVEGNSNTFWMTVEPFEINSFKKIIEEASGNVLLLGCGLGYLAYMLSLKPEVQSITVVDNNEEVLDIFTTYILPQFENKDKVQTIKSDAIEYLKTYDLTSYDYVNVDIWYDTIDMIYSYLRCLEIEKNNPTVKFSYWLENNLKEELQKAILSSICDYPTLGFLIDRIGKDIVRDTPINNYQDVYNLVDIQNLRDLLYKWYCNNLEVVQTYESSDIGRLNRIQDTNLKRTRKPI